MNIKDYLFNRGYCMLPIKVSGLPETIEINGEQLFLKTEFHVTLLSLKNVPNLTLQIENDIVQFFLDFVKDFPISFEAHRNDFRFVEKDGKKSVVLLCTVKNLQLFFEKLNSAFQLDVPVQPAHVTLYTIKDEPGISLNSQEEVQNFTQSVGKDMAQAFSASIVLT